MDAKMKKIAGIEATKVVNKHEKKMHGMKKGGITSMDAKRMGRNMARAMNQKSSSRGR